MRTPRSTVGSYSKASCGVRFIRSSRATRACRTPCAAASPSSVFARLASEPSTLTKTRACRRSGEVSTPVTVTKPIRGSFSSPTPTETTSRTASLTRRILSPIRGIQAVFGQLGGRSRVLPDNGAEALLRGLVHRRHDGGSNEREPAQAAVPHLRQLVPHLH